MASKKETSMMCACRLKEGEGGCVCVGGGRRGEEGWRREESERKWEDKRQKRN